MAQVNLSWSVSPKLIAAEFGTLRRQLVDDLRSRIEALGDMAAERANDLTPRSDGPGPHIADGWEAREIDSPGALIAVEVSNYDERANEPIELEDGRTTTLLHILEYGSQAHEIRPKDAKALRFEVDGETVFTKLVHHPGTKPYAMFGITVTETGVLFRRTIDAYRRFLLLRKGV